MNKKYSLISLSLLCFALADVRDVTANILADTGRINTGMGILMTMQAAGAALSTSYAGILAAALIIQQHLLD